MVRELLSSRRMPFLLGTLLAFAVITSVDSGQAAAGTTQIALFLGLGATPNTNQGMDNLNSTLSVAGIPNYDGMVFAWNQKQAAFDWIQQASDRTTLIVIGHSFGGNSTLQLANNFLLPAGVDVDLTVQIDSVENFDGGWNNQLPANVDVGISYYQIAAGGDVQGEVNVQGATNINAEVVLNDTSITHFTIDDNTSLHDLIVQHVLDNLNQDTADFDGSGLVDGDDFLLWQRGGSPDPLSQSDLTLWESTYGMSAPLVATAIPEPHSLALLCLGGLLISSSRRRATLLTA